MAPDTNPLNRLARRGAPALRLTALAAAWWCLAILNAAPSGQDGQSAVPRRIICVVPAVTEMLFAIGAGPQVVAVGSYDMYPPEARKLPHIGALLDPDVERILSLKPDLAVLFETQGELRKQLERAGVVILPYRDAGLREVTAVIRDLGLRTGHGGEANQLAARIDEGLEQIRRRAEALPRPRTLLVFGRERLALRGIYASGGIGFLDDMLRLAGGENLFADVKLRAVQASTETILARRPDVILEIRAADSALATGERTAEIGVWRTLSSLPAVRDGRVQFLIDDRLVIPGPRVVEGTRLMARALHPEVFK